MTGNAWDSWLFQADTAAGRMIEIAMRLEAPDAASPADDR
jgi:hypothetical protein